MPPDFLEAARTERKRLFTELNANPKFKQWWALRKLVAAYGAVVDDEDEPQAPSPALQSTQPQATSGQRQSRSGSQASRIEDAAAEWLAFHGRRAQSLEIMRALVAQGFQFRGAKPTTTLASVLSHSDLFDNVRGEGYGLKSWSANTTQTPLDSETNASS